MNAPTSSAVWLSHAQVSHLHRNRPERPADHRIARRPVFLATCRASRRLSPPTEDDARTTREQVRHRSRPRLWRSSSPSTPRSPARSARPRATRRRWTVLTRPCARWCPLTKMTHLRRSPFSWRRVSAAPMSRTQRSVRSSRRQSDARPTRAGARASWLTTSPRCSRLRSGPRRVFAAAGTGLRRPCPTRASPRPSVAHVYQK